MRKSINMKNPPKANNSSLFDVLFGRGNGLEKLPGNQYYRSLVRRQKQIYQTRKSNKEKIGISESIIYTIKSKGGKFYHKPTKERTSCGAWVEVPQLQLVDKVKQALREKRKQSTNQVMSSCRIMSYNACGDLLASDSRNNGNESSPVDNVYHDDIEF